MNICAECQNKLNKKSVYTCNECKRKLCSKHAYFYQDESNIAITKHSKAHCLECYKKKYGR